MPWNVNIPLTISEIGIVKYITRVSSSMAQSQIILDGTCYATSFVVKTLYPLVEANTGLAGIL